MKKVVKHYNLLVENGNDPVLDNADLQEYMNKWDGNEFINELNLSLEKDVLEIGCGTGRIAKKVVGLCKSYLGIDISDKTIKVAKIHFYNIDNSNFICGDFNKYKFDSKFDIIYSTLTFMHIKSKKKAIKKVYNLLKPNGKFVLSIDKNQQKYIDTGFSKIRVYPDDYKRIFKNLKSFGIKNINVKEIDNAYIISLIR